MKRYKLVLFLVMVKKAKASSARPTKKPRVKKDRTLFFSVPQEKLEPSLAQHLRGEIAQKARFDKISGKYQYVRDGRTIKCGGLIRTLKRQYYPHYQDNRSRRKWKKTQVLASSKRQGKTIHAQIARSLEKKVQKPKAMTVAVLKHFKDLGHTLQAAEVPVELLGWTKITQADVLTRDAYGKLWLWELKTGMPTGFFRKQGELRGLPGVEATKVNCWHLQLAYTRKALELAHVNISQSRILHVYEHKKEGVIIKEYAPEKWCENVAKTIQQKPFKVLNGK